MPSLRAADLYLSMLMDTALQELAHIWSQRESRWNRASSAVWRRLESLLPSLPSCSHGHLAALGHVPLRWGFQLFLSLSCANLQPSDALPFWLELVCFCCISCGAWHLSQTPCHTRLCPYSPGTDHSACEIALKSQSSSLLPLPQSPHPSLPPVPAQQPYN